MRGPPAWQPFRAVSSRTLPPAQMPAGWACRPSLQRCRPAACCAHGPAARRPPGTARRARRHAAGAAGGTLEPQPDIRGNRRAAWLEWTRRTRPPPPSQPAVAQKASWGVTKDSPAARHGVALRTWMCARAAHLWRLQLQHEGCSWPSAAPGVPGFAAPVLEHVGVQLSVVPSPRICRWFDELREALAPSPNSCRAGQRAGVGSAHPRQGSGLSDRPGYLGRHRH